MKNKPKHSFWLYIPVTPCKMIVFRCFILTAKTDGMDYLERYSLKRNWRNCHMESFLPHFPDFSQPNNFLPWKHPESVCPARRERLFLSRCSIPETLKPKSKSKRFPHCTNLRVSFVNRVPHTAPYLVSHYDRNCSECQYPAPEILVFSALPSTLSTNTRISHLPL